MSSPAPSPRTRAPLSARWRAVAGPLLETTVLFALVTVVAGGVFADGDPEPPIRLGLVDVPALAAVAAFAVLRPRWQAIAGRLQIVPPFVVFAAIATALAAAAHPDPDLGRLLSGGAGVLVGAFFGWLGVPAHAFATALEGDEARPWREIHVGAALAFLGSLAGAARGGAVLSAPTILLGILVLARALREDARDLADGRTSRAGAAARVLLGLAILLLGAGLLVVTTAVSLGLRPMR